MPSRRFSRGWRRSRTIRTISAVTLATAALASLNTCDFTQSCTTNVRPTVEVSAEFGDACDGGRLPPGLTIRCYDEDDPTIAWSVTCDDQACHHQRPGGATEDFSAWGGTWDAIPNCVEEERPGRYTVMIEHPCYETWTQDGIEAGRQGCHVDTASVHAELTPRPCVCPLEPAP